MSYRQKTARRLDYDERITTLGRCDYAIVLIHGDRKNHSASKLALKRWGKYKTKYDIAGMETVEVVDSKVKEWLTSNSMGIVVTELPCILVTRAGRKTVCYDISYLDEILRGVCETIIDFSEVPQ